MNAPDRRPDAAKVALSAGALMILIPVVLFLLALFVALIWNLAT